MTAELTVGCSSWTAEAWWERVYPRTLSDGERLGYYAQRYPAVEVDSTFYSMPREFLSARWARSTPSDFGFTVKMTRELLKPRDAPDIELDRAFGQGIAPLGKKLWAVLLQFPPSFRPDREEGFLRERLDTLPRGPRYAVELRDRRWYEGEAWRSLRRSLTDRRIALVWSYLTYVDVPPEVTTDFLYVRFIGDHTTVPTALHGEVRIERGEVLRDWAERIRRRMDDVGHVFAFFNNHFAGFAPASVNAFRAEFGLPPVAYAPPPAGRPAQRRLEG